ncbi:ABC transporter permease subunit [Pullulanibacillus sp. KACC 23026]|uniref:sugar ABC transporter permease n=1 Tax=Pullulanibacillus sp. KACC 23026 TaxID=3028315 RepID=UPI0023B1421F|nr:sugar ABC transporter permease [Pullulanibacillus sp. KACC 23026]WEG13181.1 ABC transporter permease subunit [Pullulanibacillus sp. KACC 23026]
MKQSTKAAWLSVIFMGLGQLYNRQFIKGIILFIIEAYALIFDLLPFCHSMKGLVTLGTHTQHQDGWTIVPGDDSINLMLIGIINIIIFGIFAWVYVLNARDAYKNGQLRDQGKKPNNFKETLKFLSGNGFPYVLLTPSLVITLFITMLPLLFGIMLAFTNYSSPNHLPPKNLVQWTGFQAFTQLFSMKGWSSTFVGVFTWTIVWTILSTLTCYFVGLLFAVFINTQGIRFKSFWRGIFILPWAIPQFVSILIMHDMFNEDLGPINQYLHMLHLPMVPWFSNPLAAKALLVVVNIWFGFPYWTMLMSGIMTSVNQEMYEAADVDGASPFYKFRKITLPVVLFSTAPLLIMSFAANFNNFNVIYLLTQGAPANSDYMYAGSTDILISWIYNMTLNVGQYNMASVVSLLIFIVISIVTAWNLLRSRAFREEDMMS